MNVRAITKAVFMLGLLCAALQCRAQEHTEFGVADSFVVEGKAGSKFDPDVRIFGYTLFGTNAVGAVAVTSGVGNVYIQNNLEIGSNLYVRGRGLTYPDGTTQTTAFLTNAVISTMVGGECDTNRCDILFTTNYVVTGVKVMQTSVIPQVINVFTNGAAVASFTLTTDRSARTLSLALGAYDRLGIACTNTDGVVLFSFEGHRY